MTNALLTDKSREAVALLLDSLGIGVDELIALSQGRARRTIPTFGQYIPVVIAAMPATTTLENHKSYWRKLLAEEGWADKRLDEPTVSELKALVERIRIGRQIRSDDRGGRGTAQHVVTALRCLYAHAQDDGLIDAAHNLAARVPKPTRAASSRLAIPDDTLKRINHYARTTGNDPDLDILLLRLHTETACRVGGALNLRPDDLDPAQSVVLLREKGKTERWQPVSPTLMTALLNHQHERGATRGKPLLRFRFGRPLTRERHNYLWERLHEYVPEVAARGITTHWIRHTTLTWVERHFGRAIAKGFAGHKTGSVTDIYTQATIGEIAAALQALTGEPHPLADVHIPSMTLAAWVPAGEPR